MNLDNYFANYSYRKTRYRQLIDHALTDAINHLYYKSSFVVQYIDDEDDAQIVERIKKERSLKRKDLDESLHSFLFGWLVEERVSLFLLKDFLGYLKSLDKLDIEQLKAAIDRLYELIEEPGVADDCDWYDEELNKVINKEADSLIPDERAELEEKYADRK